MDLWAQVGLPKATNRAEHAQLRRCPCRAPRVLVCAWAVLGLVGLELLLGFPRPARANTGDAAVQPSEENQTAENTHLPEPADPLAWRIDWAAQIEFELVDVEGRGGFSNRDTSQQRVDNRSPHVEIDKATFAPMFFLGTWLQVEIELRGDGEGVRIDRGLIRVPWQAVETIKGLSLRGQIGRGKPFIGGKRRTETYPLIGSIFWRGRELHLWSEFKHVNPWFTTFGGVSLAQKRPLGTDEAAEDGSFKLLVADDTRIVEGTNLAYGGKLGVDVSDLGLSAVVFGFGGSLKDNYDTQFLDQTFSGYRALGDVNRNTHYWYGGRLSFTRWGLRALTEGIWAVDGHLQRHGWFAQASYIRRYINHPLAPRLEPLLRYDSITVDKLAPNPLEPESWDRQALVAALLFRWDFGINVRTEYVWLFEKTGGPSVRDNQFVLQVEFNYGETIH